MFIFLFRRETVGRISSPPNSPHFIFSLYIVLITSFNFAVSILRETDVENKKETEEAQYVSLSNK